MVASERDEQFRNLYAKYYRRVCRFYLHVGLEGQLAEELAQDVFLRFFESMDQYQHRGETEWAYFETIARNVMYNHLRSQNTGKRAARIVTIDDSGIGEWVSSHDDPAFALIKQEREERLRLAIERLPSGMKAALDLFLDGFRYEEIAKVLGLSLDAVKSRLRDAKKHVRLIFSDEKTLAVQASAMRDVSRNIRSQTQLKPADGTVTGTRSLQMSGAAERSVPGESTAAPSVTRPSRLGSKRKPSRHPASPSSLSRENSKKALPSASASLRDDMSVAYNISMPPKVFISYSWSSRDHEQWVMELANSLVESGVDVVLDKWELREGQDKFAFMERMVTDPSINKVLIVCDCAYSEKADMRRGGVGTESQIISADVYEKVAQSKFVPIVSELREDGAPALPAYLRGRIFIDMSSEANRYENFEQLLRWIYDKPLHQKPRLGKPPSYIVEPDAPQLGTTTRFRAAIEAVKLSKPSAVAVVEDYFDAFATNLEALRVVRSSGSEYDDEVVASIDAFKAFRDESIDLVALIARYRSDREMYDVIHRWLERLLAYKYAPEGTQSWRSDDFDNFKFILIELFLYTIAVLLKSRRYLQTRWFLEERYFVPAAVSRSDAGRLDAFDEFQDHVQSLDETRIKRLGLRRMSLTSDMLKERATRKDLSFADLMQAEFVLIVYSLLHLKDRVWFPTILIYASHGGSPFEIFLRGTSRRGFQPIKELFEVESAADLVKRLDTNGARYSWGRGFDHVDPHTLMNATKLESQP